MSDALPTALSTVTYESSATGEKNVIDHYKAWEMEAIKADLDSNRVPMVNICMNLTSDFNKGSVIRASNAFLGQDVWLVGSKKFDRRGAVGTHHYEHIKHSTHFEPLFDHLISQGYTIYPVDNIASRNPKPLYDVEFPEKSAFLYGEEQAGLPEEVIDACNGDMIYIPQYGSVRSLNVAQAAAVIMSEYTRQRR